MRPKPPESWLRGLLVLMSLVLLLTLTASAAAAAAAVAVAAPGATPGLLKVHFIDVGQGDSILIQTVAGANVLIDGGPETAGSAVINYLKKAGVASLDAVIATHPHEDHIGGLVGIMETFKVAAFYMPNAAHTTAAFRDMVAAVKASGARRIEAKAGVNLGLEGVTATMLGPLGTKYAQLNDFSAVLRLDYGTTSFLFMGDAEGVSEGQLLAAGLGHATIVKVSHHGSGSPTSQGFLKRVSPQYAVICVGAGNTHGHPDPLTISRLVKGGVAVYRTDLNGTITASSDGKKVSVATTRTPPAAEKGKAGAGNLAPIAATGAGAVVAKPAATSATVYITRTGEKYHLAGCRYLARSQIPIKLADAKAQGYTPCSVCKPPK